MDKSNNMFLNDVVSLQETVTEAMELLNKYETENKALKARMESLTHEKALLLQKNDQARSRLESMISRLKALEQKSA